MESFFLLYLLMGDELGKCNLYRSSPSASSIVYTKFHLDQDEDFFCCHDKFCGKMWQKYLIFWYFWVLSGYLGETESAFMKGQNFLYTSFFASTIICQDQCFHIFKYYVVTRNSSSSVVVVLELQEINPF